MRRGVNEPINDPPMLRIGKSEITVLGVILAFAVAHFKLWRQKTSCQKHLYNAKRLLDTETKKRAAERIGRIRAEVKPCTKHDMPLHLESQAGSVAWQDYA